jgi:uncharacterized membrane protein SirB2
MLYDLIKQLHVAAVVISLAGFAARGGLMLAASPLLERRWLRVAPHVVDTILLASGIWLAWLSSQYPFVQPWLTAKLLGLVAYIACGMVALRRGKTPAVRGFFFALSLLAAAYIVSVAVTRDPAGFLVVWLRQS